MDEQQEKIDLHLELTTDIVSAYVSNNPVPVAELPSLIGDVHKSLTGLATAAPAEENVEPLKLPVSIRKSMTPGHLISMEDGKPYKSLRRHLSARGMTPDDYRAKWGLPADYPMVSPNYSAARSEMARKIGLGRKPVTEGTGRRKSK